MLKKDILIAFIISEITAGLFFLVWLNLGLFLQYWDYRWFLFIVAPILSISFFILFHFLNKKVSWDSKRVSKFVLVGTLNTFLDFGILNLLSYLFKIYFGWWVAVFNVVSFLIANINSFFWNKNWTFQFKEKKGMKGFLKFFMVSVGGLIINTIILLISLELFRVVLPELNLVVSENLSKVLAVLISKYWNYFGYKLFAFKRKN
jgi:putative flippase GtrA